MDCPARRSGKKSEKMRRKERDEGRVERLGHEKWNDELQGAAMNQRPATGGTPTNNAGPPFFGAHQGCPQTPFSVYPRSWALEQSPTVSCSRDFLSLSRITYRSCRSLSLFCYERIVPNFFLFLFFLDLVRLTNIFERFCPMERFFLILERNQKEESFRDYVEWKRKFSTQIYNDRSFAKEKVEKYWIGLSNKNKFYGYFYEVTFPRTYNLLRLTKKEATV